MAGVRAILLLFVAICLAGLPACSFFKSTKKPTQPVSSSDAGLISKGTDEVKAKFGEPTVIARTNEDHVLWIYQPTWKIMPNDDGTLYVEFAEGKVIKIFKKK